MKIKLTINGENYERDVAENRTLLRFIREDVGLTGTKEGCGAGECGACTIYLNGRTVNACMVLAVEANGAVVETIEGEAKKGLCPNCRLPSKRTTRSNAGSAPRA